MVPFWGRWIPLGTPRQSRIISRFRSVKKGPDGQFEFEILLLILPSGGLVQLGTINDQPTVILFRVVIFELVLFNQKCIKLNQIF